MVEINNILAGLMSIASSQRIRHSRQGIIPFSLKLRLCRVFRLRLCRANGQVNDVFDLLSARAIKWGFARFDLHGHQKVAFFVAHLPKEDALVGDEHGEYEKGGFKAICGYHLALIDFVEANEQRAKFFEPVEVHISALYVYASLDLSFTYQNRVNPSLFVLRPA